METVARSEHKTRLDCSGNEIHLWVTRPRFIQQPELLTRYKNLLTADELCKQQSYQFTKHRHNALLTRAFIRDLLSHYADVPPADWRFATDFYGKPELVDAPLSLRFNISHTDDLIICAVTLNDEIGCDAEMTGRSCDFLPIAEHCFSDHEYDELLRLREPQQRRSRFFDYWTLKESYIKAWGQGLSIPLADFNFHIGSARYQQYNDNISISFAANRADSDRLWRCWLFYPSRRHRIAVAVKSQSDNHARPYRFRYFEHVPLLATKELNYLGVSN